MHKYSKKSYISLCGKAIYRDKMVLKPFSTARRIQPTIEPQRFRGIMKCFPRVIPYQASRWRF